MSDIGKDGLRVKDDGVTRGWKVPGIIARHRPYFYYRHPDLFPCDTFGFRVPDGHASAAAKYRASEGKAPIFCFGGSTTFGSYVTYGQSWPAVLERLTGRPVFNFGLQELDLHANLYTFIDVLREGMRPDTVIFYDGINEKIAFRQAERGREAFVTEHVQYEGFTELLRLTDIRGRIRDKISRLLGKAPAPVTAVVDEDTAKRFALAQAEHYLGSRRAAAAIAEGLGIRALFVLQPTLWDVTAGFEPLRGLYMRTMYDHITAREPTVLDISGRCRLRSDMFYDACHLTVEGYEEIARVIMSEGGVPCVA